MSVIYQFPTNVELDVVVQEYQVDHEKLILEEVLPFEDHAAQRVRWDEEDNETGMTPPHNMDSEPRVDERPGSRTHEYEAIPFKGSELLKESDILRARELGTLGGVVNIDREVLKRVRARMDKTHLRAEWCRAQVLATGALTIVENGVAVNETFNIPSYTPLVPHDDPENATPLKDANAVALMFAGTGASPRGAVEYMNQFTFNTWLENRNDDDIRGFRSENFSDVTFDITNINKMLERRGLPIIKVYDEGYIDKNKVFQRFIPDGKSFVVGKRPLGQKPGAFAMTASTHRTKNGQFAPGFFAFVEVNGQPNRGTAMIDAELLGSAANPNIKITGGVYGGPLIRYPRSIVRKNLF